MSTVTSHVLDIYDAIAAQAVTITSTGEVIASWNLSEAHDAVEAADLPTRMLMPFESTYASNQRGTGVTLGPMPLYKVQWGVNELMLYRPANSGLGIAEFAPVLTEYCGAYTNVIANARAPQGGGSIVLENWSCQPTVIEFPQSSGIWFFGVVSTLVYTENMTLQG